MSRRELYEPAHGPGFRGARESQQFPDGLSELSAQVARLTVRHRCPEPSLPVATTIRLVPRHPRSRETRASSLAFLPRASPDKAFIGAIAIGEGAVRPFASKLRSMGRRRKGLRGQQNAQACHT